MTNSVGILCGDKIWKQVLTCTVFASIIAIFFLGQVAIVSAQAGGIGGVDRPLRPGDPPPPPGMDYGTPLNPNDPNLLPPGYGGGDAPVYGGRGEGAQGPVSEAERAAAAESAYAAQNLGSAPDGVLGFLYSYALSGLGWLVGIAGSAFDYAITNYIIGFGRLYITGTGETIDALWGTVRDIFNLTFIFGLVYIGFKMILDSSDSSARKMLVSLIAAALLVNFSLFITKFVIDFSNIAATQVWNAFEGRSLTGAAVDTSITGGFMTMLGVNSMIEYMYVGGGSFTYVFGIIIIFAILAYVFLAGAVMIIIRFVVLNIYMVFSPFMFLGWVFPALASYSRDYWSGFLRQAFFAPAFIFMLYLSYMVASTFPVQRNLDRIFNPNMATVSEYADTIPYFAMVIVFLLASMVVAKKMGAHGATVAVSTGKNIAGRAGRGLRTAAGGATFGMAGRLGRNTAGLAGQKIASSDRLKELAAQKGLKGWSARQALRSGRVVADSTFDARGIAGAGAMLGIGAGVKGGYKTKMEATAKRDTAFAESLGTVDDKDIRVATRTKERDEADMALRIAKKDGTPQQIKLAEDNLKKANETLEQEKRRRQIGGTFTDQTFNAKQVAEAEAKIEKADEEIKEIKADLKDSWTKYKTAENTAIKNALMKEMKILEDKKRKSEAQRKAFLKGSPDGYAAVVDTKTGWDKVQSYVMGRTLHESRESADAIRKKFTKETKKSKEELNTDSIVKAVTSSAKSDH